MGREFPGSLILIYLLGVGRLFGQESPRIDHLVPATASPVKEIKETYRQAKYRALIGSRDYQLECWAIATPPNGIEYALVIERIWGEAKPGGKVLGIIGYRLRSVVAKTSVRKWLASIDDSNPNSSSMIFPETTELSVDIPFALGQDLLMAWRSVLLGTKYSRFYNSTTKELRYEFYANPHFFGEASIFAVGNAASLIQLTELLISYTKASELDRPAVLGAIQKCASMISSPAS